MEEELEFDDDYEEDLGDYDLKKYKEEEEE